MNSAGVSQFCPICYCRTPSAAPSAVTNAQAEATGTSEVRDLDVFQWPLSDMFVVCLQVIVTWEQPADNGSPISGYQVDISPASSLPNPIELPQSSTQYTLSGLQPQTSYRWNYRWLIISVFTFLPPFLFLAEYEFWLWTVSAPVFGVVQLGPRRLVFPPVLQFWNSQLWATITWSSSGLMQRPTVRRLYTVWKWKTKMEGEYPCYIGNFRRLFQPFFCSLQLFACIRRSSKASQSSPTLRIYAVPIPN